MTFLKIEEKNVFQIQFSSDLEELPPKKSSKSGFSSIWKNDPFTCCDKKTSLNFPTYSG